MTDYIRRDEAIFRGMAVALVGLNTPREIKALFDEIPAADVVEVVRCKDCDLWNEWDETGHEQTGNYACSCAYFSNEDGYVVYTRPDDYCSHGERKEV